MLPNILPIGFAASGLFAPKPEENGFFGFVSAFELEPKMEGLFSSLAGGILVGSFLSAKMLFVGGANKGFEDAASGTGVIDLET